MKELPCPPEHWPEFSRLLDEAFELAEPERHAWLDRLAEEFSHLRPWLARVLLADAQIRTGDYLDQPRLPAGPESEDGFCAGQTVGAYRLYTELGRGGMGEVWSARRADGSLDRQVALKLPHPWLFAKGMRQRLQRERDILASLVHPHIAQLYDAGITAEGQPFLALELVEGRPIDRYCREEKLGLAARIALFAQVLDSVRYAHSRLVVHRDLKPSNILIDAQGQAKLLDFGIAKLLDEQGGGSASELTRLAGRALTPEYAAPEQIAGDAVTVATDVFSVGVVLFELLAGRRPFGRERPNEVPLASTAVLPAQAGDTGCANVRELRRQLTGDLDAILARCLAPSPAERYGSVEQLAEDLERHARLEPIRARRIGRAERGLRFIRRNGLAVAMSASLAVVVAAGVTGTVLQTRRAEASATQARDEARRADLTKNFMFDVLVANDVRIPTDRPRDRIPAGELLEYGIDHIHQDRAADPEAQIQLLQLGAAIYGFWNNQERKRELLRQRAAIAEKAFGALHPAVIQSLIVESGALAESDGAGARRLLAEADRRLTAANLDRSLLRVDWWDVRFRLIPATVETVSERIGALRSIIALVSSLAPDEPLNFVARLNLAALELNDLRYADARNDAQQGLDALARSLRMDRTANYAASGHRTLAYSLQALGELDEAEIAWQRAEVPQAENPVLRDTSVENQAIHAYFVDLRGDPDRAQRLLQGLEERAAKPDAAPGVMEVVRLSRGYCFDVEGRTAEAVQILEPMADGARGFDETDRMEFDRILGDAYDRQGRGDDARRLLDADLALATQGHFAASSAAFLLRERRARFLLEHGDAEGARSGFAAIVVQAKGLDQAPAALALGGVARLALHDSDAGAALAASTRAVAAIASSRPLHDVREAPYLWRIHADALRRSDRFAEADRWATQALEAERHAALTPAPAASPSKARAAAQDHP